MWKFKNIFWWATTIINTLFILFNVYYTCHWYNRVPKELGFDYIGVIVGILSALITIAVGWQFFYQLKIEDKLKEIAKTEVEKNSLKILETIINNTLKTNIKDAEFYTISRDYNRVLSLYNSILEEYLLLQDKKHIVEIVSAIKILIRTHGFQIHSFYKDEAKKVLKQAVPYTNDAYELLKELDR